MNALPGLRRVEQIMGMPIVLDVRDPVDEALAEAVFDWFREVDERFSTYKDSSEISRLNRGELAVRDCHPDVRWILARCDELREETGGFFDARYESLLQVDPSGLVKGWSVDRAGELLEAGGIGNYSINAAGDIRTRGAALPEPTWRTGIQHPELMDRIAAVVEANDLALATSGTYARGQHIVDPHTGLPPAGLLSVTIAGPDLGTADAYATAAFAMGEQGPGWTSMLRPYEALCILADGSSLATAGFPLANPVD
ncbi:MAG TPA: FAD:protein FMN transferase [Gaiellaceae bacterium]|nr:FAD:protein FMN transferase [Gaiellaceae bacterium]